MSISCSAAVMLMEACTLIWNIFYARLYAWAYTANERESSSRWRNRDEEGSEKKSENKKKSIREIRIDGSEKKNIYIYTYIIRKKEKIRRKEGSGIKNKIPPTIAYISFPRAIGISRSCTHRYSKSWFTIESRDLESKEEEEEDS